MDRLMLLKKIKDEIIEDRNKAQEEARENNKNGRHTPSVPSVSMPSSVQSLASKYGVSLPNVQMPHY